MSQDTLLEGATALGVALGERDRESAARTAHRMKGVALEIGLDPLADIARIFQTAVLADAWAEAEREHALMLSALGVAAKR